MKRISTMRQSISARWPRRSSRPHYSARPRRLPRSGQTADRTGGDRRSGAGNDGAPRAARWVPGSVVSRDDAKIASAEAGRLEYVAEVGTRVKAGERLAKLDDQALRLRREEIQSDVRRAEAQRALTETQLQRLREARHVERDREDPARRSARRDGDQCADAGARARPAAPDRSRHRSGRLVHAPFAGVVTERFAQRGEYLQVGATHRASGRHRSHRSTRAGAADDGRQDPRRHAGDGQGRRPGNERERAHGGAGRRRARAPVRTARRRSSPRLPWSAAPSKSRCPKTAATKH